MYDLWLEESTNDNETRLESVFRTGRNGDFTCVLSKFLLVNARRHRKYVSRKFLSSFKWGLSVI
jgi:hypothetical protein